MKSHGFKPVYLIPHIVHCALGVTAIVLSCEILKSIHRVGKGLKEIKEGHEEMKKGRHDIFGHGKKG